nr:hypothetical protein [uncultured Sphingobacterium sp.]
MNQIPKDKKSNLHVSLTDSPDRASVRLEKDFYDDRSGVKHKLVEFVTDGGGVNNQFYYGDDATLRYSLCIGDGGIPLYSIPEEPVVMFHIQQDNEQYAKFEQSDEWSRWSKGEIRLAWQSNETIVYELSPGYTNHIDLFVRPDLFLEMANKYPVLREMAMEVKTAKNGNLDLFVSNPDGSIHLFATEMLHELQRYEVSTQRFQHLCECLLLRSMGIVLPVEPLAPDAVQREKHLDWSDFDDSLFQFDDDDEEDDDEGDDLFTPYQDYLLDNLKAYGKEELVHKFYTARTAFYELKGDYLKNKKLLKKLKEGYLLLMEDSGELLAEAYFSMALGLDAQTEKFLFDDREKHILRDAIICVMNQCFALRTVKPEQVNLYNKWSKKPYFPKLEITEFENMMEIIGLQLNIDVSEWGDTKESTAVFCEHLQDQLGGFRSFSNFMGRDENNKPQVLVELYHKLMQNLSDELTITDEGEIKKSDIIRILDHAYDSNDPIQLLLIEIEYFSHDVNYVKMQGEDKIRYWIIALEDRSKELHKQMEMLEKDRLFRLIHIYEQSPAGLLAVDQLACSEKETYENITESLLIIVKGMADCATKEIVLGIAKSMIIA